MTMTRDRRGNGFILTCDTCGTKTLARGENAFDVARTAKHAGWTIAAKDRCRSCPTPNPIVRAKRRK